jgi:hypothetical protein
VLLVALDVYAEHSGRSAQAAMFAALVVVGYVALGLLPAVLRPAGVALIVVGVPGALGWWFLPEADRFGDVRPFLVSTIAGMVICWLVPRTRGRAVFVGVAALFLWLWLLGEAAGLDGYSAAPVPSPPARTTFSPAALTARPAVTLDELDPADPLYGLAERCRDGSMTSCDALYQVAPFGSDFREYGASCGDRSFGTAGECATGAGRGDFGFGSGDDFESGFGDDFESGFGDDFENEPPFSFSGGEGDSDLEVGLVSSLLGAAYVAALALLDRRRQVAVATAFVVPGGLALFTGTQSLGNAANQPWLGGLLTFAAGLAFGAVGHLGERRFTTWAGGAMAALGAVTIALDLTDVEGYDIEGNVKLLAPGLLVVAAGVTLVAVAYLVAGALAGGRPGGPARRGGEPVAPAAAGVAHAWGAAPSPPAGPPPGPDPGWPSPPGAGPAEPGRATGTWSPPEPPPRPAWPPTEEPPARRAGPPAGPPPGPPPDEPPHR